MSIRSARDALAATYTTAEPSPNTPDGPQCLRWVWICYGSVQSNLPPLASVAFAKQGWIYSKMQHPGDRNPPAGAPLYFSGSDGHICIATGNGEGARSTEWPWGHVGDTSISAIERAWGRTYYGWTGDMLGHPIQFDTSTAGGNATPIPTGDEFDMASLTDLQNIVQTEVTAAVNAAVTAAVATTLGAERRESRTRLYRNTDTKQLLGVNWDVDTTAANRVLYIKSDDQAAHLASVYEVVGDAPTQAVNIDPANWQTLLNLANGTDPVYKP
ncbi:MAG: hypothetical protein ABI067_17740 [Leifsonia sp.]